VFGMAEEHLTFVAFLEACLATELTAFAFAGAG
jgi:hypothetical protein